MRLGMANAAVAVLVAAVVLSMGLQPARGETREELQGQIEALSQEVEELRSSLELVERELCYLRLTGELPGGYLGAAFSTMPGEKGIVLDRVLSGYAAEQAGLEEGDVILQYGPHRAYTRDVLSYLIKSTRPGTRVEVTVSRRGELKTFSVMVATKPEADPFEDFWKSFYP